MDLTEADRGQIFRELVGDYCSVCRRFKGKGKSFCRECYVQLSQELRRGLYAVYGKGYDENYTRARNHLKSKLRNNV